MWVPDEPGTDRGARYREQDVTAHRLQGSHRQRDAIRAVGALCFAGSARVGIEQPADIIGCFSTVIDRAVDAAARDYRTLLDDTTMGHSVRHQRPRVLRARGVGAVALDPVASPREAAGMARWVDQGDD